MTAIAVSFTAPPSPARRRANAPTGDALARRCDRQASEDEVRRGERDLAKQRELELRTGRAIRTGFDHRVPLPDRIHDMCVVQAAISCRVGEGRLPKEREGLVPPLPKPVRASIAERSILSWPCVKSRTSSRDCTLAPDTPPTAPFATSATSALEPQTKLSAPAPPMRMSRP